MSDYSSTSEVEKQRLQTQRMIDDVKVALPAKIVSFSAGATPKASVQPLTQLKVTLGDEVSFVTLPVIDNVPVVIPYAQTAGLMLTLPLSAGDSGLLVIPDRGIDTFLKGRGEVTPPPFSGDPTTATPRAHSLTDGIFIPGLSADSMEIQDYKTDKIELRDKDRKVYFSLGPDGIEMSDGTGVLELKGGNFSVRTPNSATIESQNAVLGRTNNRLRDSLYSSEGTFVDKDSVSLNTHGHTGVQTGSGNTGEPVK